MSVTSVLVAALPILSVLFGEMDINTLGHCQAWARSHAWTSCAVVLYKGNVILPRQYWPQYSGNLMCQGSVSMIPP